MSDLQKKIAQLSAKAVVPEGEKWMRLVATAPTLDRDLEIIDTGSLRIPIKPRGWKYARDLTPDDQIDMPFLYDHEWSVEKQLGSVRSMFINADGELEAVVGFTSLERGVEAHTLAKEGHLGNSFSGTFDYSTGVERDGVVYEAEMIELSMVFKGANRDARILEVSKSLRKDSDMAEATEQSTEDRKAEIERLQRELAEVEAAEVKAGEVEDDLKADDQSASEEVNEVEDTVKVETTTEASTEETETTNEETNKMSEQEAKAIAKDQVVVKAAPVQAIASKPLDKTAIRKNFVLQAAAVFAKDETALKSYNQKAMELSGVTSKVIDGTSGAPLFMPEVVSNDILQEYTNVGRIGQFVDRVDILGAETYKMLVETDGIGFQPVALGAVKQQDQPIWTPAIFEPFEWAIIVPWLDGVAKRTPIAVYQQLVRYIARQFAKLEDNIILAYAGGSVGSETRPATGVVPILTANGTRTVTAASRSAADVQAAIGEAYGMIESDGTLTLVANRAEWGSLAVTVNTQGNNVFNTVGQQVAAGALGTFNVVTSEMMPPDTLVIGDFRDYLLVTRGGMETLYSREATVGSLNLFTQDASALRADVDITGGVTRVTSFVLIEFPSESS